MASELTPLWFSLVALGIFLLLAIQACITRAKIKRDPSATRDFLARKDAQVGRVLISIICAQFCFCALLLTVLSVTSAAFQQPLKWEQAFSSAEFNFLTLRGFATCLTTVIAAVIMAPIFTALISGYTNMTDYVFTMILLHFIVVSNVNRDFPEQGAWWVSMLVAFVLSSFTTEFLAYKMATMSYFSTLNGREDGKSNRKKKSNNHASLDSLVDLPELTLQERLTSEKITEVVAEDESFVEKLSTRGGADSTSQRLRPRKRTILEQGVFAPKEDGGKNRSRGKGKKQQPRGSAASSISSYGSSHGHSSAHSSSTSESSSLEIQAEEEEEEDVSSHGSTSDGPDAGSNASSESGQESSETTLSTRSSSSETPEEDSSGSEADAGGVEVNDEKDEVNPHKCRRCGEVVEEDDRGKECRYHPGEVDTDLLAHGPGVGVLEDFWTCCKGDIGSYGSNREGEFDDRKPVPGCKTAEYHDFPPPVTIKGAAKR